MPFLSLEDSFLHKRPPAARRYSFFAKTNAFLNPKFKKSKIGFLFRICFAAILTGIAFGLLHGFNYGWKYGLNRIPVNIFNQLFIFTGSIWPLTIAHYVGNVPQYSLQILFLINIVLIPIYLGKALNTR